MTDPLPDQPYTSGPLAWAVTACGVLAGLAIAWAVSSGWSTLTTSAVVAAGSPVTLAALFALCARLSAALPRRGEPAAHRPHIAYRAWPRPALVLADQPLPTCPACGGRGGWNTYVSDGGSHEDGETLFDYCPCWNPHYAVHLVRLPRFLNRWSRQGGYSSEPPF